MLDKDGRNTTTLRAASFGILNDPVFHHARLQPLADESQQHSVTYPLAHARCSVSDYGPSCRKIFEHQSQGPTRPPSSSSDPLRLAAPYALNGPAENRTSSPENSAHRRPPARCTPPAEAPCPRRSGRWLHTPTPTAAFWVRSLMRLELAIRWRNSCSSSGVNATHNRPPRVRRTASCRRSIQS